MQSDFEEKIIGGCLFTLYNYLKIILCDSLK